MNTYFQYGGTLLPEAPCLVPRAVQGTLMKTLKRHRWSWISAPVQSGKSSLLSLVGNRLREEGHLVAPVDLTALQHGDDIGLAIVNRLGREYDASMEDVFDQFYLETVRITPWDRLLTVCGWILEHQAGELFLFIDEINRLRSWHAELEFFGFLSRFRESSMQSPQYDRRLSVCLAGLNGPSRDVLANIDLSFITRFPLDDLSWNETRNLAKGFEESMERRSAQRVLKRVFAWTSGHPYLTQRVCALVSRKLNKESDHHPEHLVDTVCSDICSHWDVAAEEEVHLSYLSELVFADSEESEKLAGTFNRLKSGEPVRMDPDSELLVHSGLAREDRRGLLEIRNRLYKEAFPRPNPRPPPAADIRAFPLPYSPLALSGCCT